MDFVFKEKLGSNFYADCYIATSRKSATTSAQQKPYQQASPQRNPSPRTKKQDESICRVKVIKPQFIDSAMKNYLVQQLSYMKQLNIDDIHIPELIETDGSLILKSIITEQQTLSYYIETHNTLTIKQTLELGIDLCQCLEARHTKNWVHKSIKPNNITYSATTRTVLLLDDLGIITPNQFSRLISDPAYCRDSLPYYSPEQCGRIRRDVDYRSDLYSLGCVLYRCLTGQPVFVSENAQRIIHSHLAEMPDSVRQHRPNSPTALNNIIERLLEKQTEKRYQTAYGLKRDLLICLQMLDRNDDSDFTLMQEDFSNEITLPSLLLGREQEKKDLLDLYQQIGTGKLGVAYITGLSGIGKSRLVQELEVPILMRHGLFVSGKYNQFSKHQPYATIAQAMGQLIRTILTETEAHLQSWKNTILNVVGINGQLLITVIPELSLLIGDQPTVNSLPPAAARNRFNDLFCRFMNCLATKDHPLVLFIDDLQWCDDATLDLLDKLVAHPDRHPFLLLILAFRNNEVEENHRIRQTRKSLQNGATLLLDIALSELNKSTVNQMTACILRSPPQETLSITDAIYPTCGGNPLLVNESLRWLHQQRGIFYDVNGQWQWKESTLKGLQLPNGYLALFKNQLTRLTPTSRNILASASLLGARFEERELAALLNTSINDLIPQLSESISQRILIREKTELVFGHDQIQMAATTLHSPAKAKRIHKKIAQSLIDQFQQTSQLNPEIKQGQRLYSIAEHLKKSRAHQLGDSSSITQSTGNQSSVDPNAFNLNTATPITINPNTNDSNTDDPNTNDPNNIQEAKINLLAGEAALNSLAHSTADYYFSEAASLCNYHYWQLYYDFMLSLHKNYARSALLVGDQIRSNEIMNKALTYAKSDLDRTDCLLAQTVAITSLGKKEEAMELSLKCCQLLQCPIPETEEKIKAEIAQHAAILQHPTCVTQYRNLAATSNRKVLMELALNAELVTLFYLSGKLDLVFLTSMRSIVLTLREGKSPDTHFAFAVTGSYFHFQKDFSLALQYETALLEEVEKSPYEFSSIRAMIAAIWLTLHHSRTLSELQDICHRNIQNGKRAGELNFTGLTYPPLIWYQLTKGENISQLRHQIREGLEYCEQFDISMPLEICHAIEIALTPLWGDLPEGHQKRRQEKIDLWHSEQHVAALFNYYFYRAIIAYYSEQYTKAEQALINAESFLYAVPGTMIERLWYAYRYLVGIHTGENPAAADQMKRVTEWAQDGPILEPFLHLMHAETHAANHSNLNELRNRYWQAIDSAHEQGNHFYEAHAYHRLGSALEQRQHNSSQLYFNEAINLYKKCNATYLVTLLSEGGAFRLPSKAKTADHPPLDHRLDFKFLLEATKNIMKERDYDALLLQVLSSTMARVGAKNGYLIGIHNGNFNVLAHGRKNANVETFRLKQEMNKTEKLCPEIARFVIRSRSPVVLENASITGDFCHSTAVKQYKLKSVLAFPLLVQDHILGLIYLENSLMAGVFGEDQVSLLQVLTTQAAIALDNSLLISNLQKTQDTLIQREQNLSITLNSIGDGVIVTDEIGNVSRINPVAETLTGWSITEAKDKAVSTIFKVIDTATRNPIIDPANHRYTQITLISKKGKEYPISHSTAPIRTSDNKQFGMVHTFNDQSEAYRLRKEIDEEQQLQSLILGNLAEAVMLTDHHGVIQLFNTSACTMFDYTEQEIIGKKITILIAGRRVQPFELHVKEYRRATEIANLGSGIDVKAKRKNGEIFTFHISITELPGMTDSPKRYAVSGLDLTARELQQEMLQRSQKMEALGKLTGGIAHDYNNTLSVIQGYSELIMRDLTDDSGLKNYVEQILYSTQRSSTLTDKLVSYSRQKLLQTDTINISQFLKTQHEMLEKTLTSRIQLNLEMDKNTHNININVNLGDLEDTILNLCINAMHAMPEGGRLTIKAKQQNLFDRDAKALQIKTGNHLVISITDTGTGMNKDTQNKIFDPFFTTKGDRGSGLGLSQVYSFIKRNHFAISVISEVNVGSCFSLYFPISKLSVVSKNKKQLLEEDLSGSQTILVVDDEPALIRVNKQILQNYGYNVFCAKNAEDAMGIIKSQSIDLVLCDVIMPRTNGYQLANIIRQYDSTIPIQLISGYDDDFQLEEGDHILRSELLSKPLKTQTLLRKVKEILSA
ncbi:MAG: AAA family ATPase [Pseudomonadales bacterium]|nr:AAA family ATPase [Pseudomonadales bacterium]